MDGSKRFRRGAIGLLSFLVAAAATQALAQGDDIAAKRAEAAVIVRGGALRDAKAALELWETYEDLAKRKNAECAALRRAGEDARNAEWYSVARAREVLTSEKGNQADKCEQEAGALFSKSLTYQQLYLLNMLRVAESDQKIYQGVTADYLSAAAQYNQATGMSRETAKIWKRTRHLYRQQRKKTPGRRAIAESRPAGSAPVSDLSDAKAAPLPVEGTASGGTSAAGS
jgi:hypothetical protein